MNDLHGLTARHFMDQFPFALKDGGTIEALGETIAAAMEQRYGETAEAAIYPRIDVLEEPVVDLLAAELGTPMYREDLRLATKRRLVKETLLVKRIAGTVGAVLRVLNALYPGTELEEWFSYNGNPLTFRIYLDITNSAAEEPARVYDLEEMERMLRPVKRWAAHLDSISYMIKRRLVIGHKIKSWAYMVPFCGTIRCGTWWMISTLGWSEHHALLTVPKPEPFAVSPELSGTLPDTKTVGWSTQAAVLISGRGEGFADRLEYAGTIRSGTAAVVSTLGWSEHVSLRTGADVGPLTAAPELSGTLPETRTAGWSVTGGEVLTSGAAAGFVGLPPTPGSIHAGTLPGVSVLGCSLSCGMIRAGGTVAGFDAAPELTGTLPEEESE